MSTQLTPTPTSLRDDDKRPLRTLSVVAPVYDEEATINEFYARVCRALEGLRFELILVDDGSTDATPAALDRLAAGDPRVRVVYLSRNFGHQTALTAGLDHARGDAVVMLDADLQDPPELIPRMLDHWREGCDIVYAVREQREGESRFKLTTAQWFYKLFDKLAQVELQHNSGDFRLLDRGALDALLSMRERNRFLRGMTVWVGYRQAAVPYRRDPRYAGETKYTVSRMLRFSLDAISSFSHRPLQLATLLGFMISTLAFIAIPVVIGLRIAGSYLPGFGSITIVVLLLGGIQLIAIGIIGEYVGRIYDEVKGRPLYLVRARLNMSEDEARSAGFGPIVGPPRLPPSPASAAGRNGLTSAPSPRPGASCSSAAMRLERALIASAIGSGKWTQSASGPSGRRPSTRTGCPGLPTTVEFGGMSWMTTLLAPIFEPCPTVIGPSSFAPEPIVTLSSTVGWRLPAANPVPPSVTP
jgi:dolichol-phosphate mannosyltransferase